MAVRVTYIAIAVGGACGAFAALVSSPSQTPATAEPLQAPMGSLPLRPIGELAHATPSTEPPVRPLASTKPAPSANALAVASATASAPLAPSSSSVAVTPAALSSAEPIPAPATKDALLRAEMRCDQKDAAACVLAARGYETGSAGPTDAEKAIKYRKIALTMWISQCDHNSASACATLADMYRAGSGVPQNEKNAAALVTRTRELCHYNDAPVCHQFPAQ